MRKNQFFSNFIKTIIFCSLFLSPLCPVLAQTTGKDTVATFKPKGQLWGCAFGDYAYKSQTDALNRGNTNQYTGIANNTNMFQWRRIYLGYNYELSEHFAADFLLSAENDWAAGLLGQTANTFDSTTSKGVLKSNSVKLGGNGDVLMNNKFAPFVKLANVRWNNIWKNSDLVAGIQNTSAYGKNGRNLQTSEEVWSYRSIEKTISDLYGTPCFDFGISLQGWFDKTGSFGYEVMVGNGQKAYPENDIYKWFYADVYAKFFGKKLIFDLYQDYEKLNWGVYTKGPNGAWYHDRNMTKLFVAYTSKKFTVGFEGFQNTILGDLKVVNKDNNTYYRTLSSMAATLFVRGRILSFENGDAKLGYFARFDNFDPSGNISNIANDANAKSFTAVTAAYDPTVKQQFIVLGFDYTPHKHVHIMPNVWIFNYTPSVSPTATNAIFNNPNITTVNGSDVVWRLTFFYTYGK